jgi:hypothetical protein
MKSFLRQLILLAIAGYLSWWIFLASPLDSLPTGGQVPASAPEITLTPVVHSVQPVTEAEAADREPPTPPPAEAGTPDGEQDGPPNTSAEEIEEGEPSESVGSTSSKPEIPGLAEIMEDSALVLAAQDELGGRGRLGFTTVLLAQPEDQLDIAKFFGEQVVLVPKSAINPSAASPRYFRISIDGPTGVETVHGRPSLDDSRQYRDLFDYEYARLPAPLRELRRSVLSRNEVFLFAALISPPEWAVVMTRREAALAEAGRGLSEVRSFQLRYRRLTAGRFEVEVAEILFQDGSRFSPQPGE